MMKLSRFLLSSRKGLSKDLLYGKDGSLSHTYSTSAGVSTAEQKFGLKVEGGVSASYIVYKGKAALSVSPVLPTFAKLPSGLTVVNRKGAMMLKFIPAIGERKYDWEKKQIFALSPTEVGSLISLGSNDSCEFFHDPSMLSSNAGQVRKSLSIKPHANGGGYMISLNVANNILKTRENYALPHILGWDQLTKGADRSSESERHRSSPARLDKRLLDSEWEK